MPRFIRLFVRLNVSLSVCLSVCTMPLPKQVYLLMLMDRATLPYAKSTIHAECK